MTAPGNTGDASRFAAALAPLRALLESPPLMTDVCARRIREAILELEHEHRSCVNAERWAAECAAFEAEDK